MVIICCGIQYVITICICMGASACYRCNDSGMILFVCLFCFCFSCNQLCQTTPRNLDLICYNSYLLRGGLNIFLQNEVYILSQPKQRYHCTCNAYSFKPTFQKECRFEIYLCVHSDVTICSPMKSRAEMYQTVGMDFHYSHIPSVT